MLKLKTLGRYTQSISIAAAIFLLSAGGLPAEGKKYSERPTRAAEERPARAQAAEQNVPVEKASPGLKSEEDYLVGPNGSYLVTESGSRLIAR
jgi:hypothetical protein